jgi:adenylate kinase family enzyme
MKRGEQGGRNDDNIETFRKRYQTYISSTMDIIHHYEAEGLVRKISTIAGPDEVFDEVKKLFDQL